MEFIQKKFGELTSLEVYKIIQLRMNVFIFEQNCIYKDLDDKDLDSIHIFCKEKNEITAYIRAIPKEISKYKEASFGRVCTNLNYRKQKIGIKIVNKAIQYIFNEMNEDKITISAQEYLVNFYCKFGFKTVGEIYLEDNIPHIEMILEKSGYKKVSKKILI